MTRWSSISLASLRASSTGWTFVLKARPKMPSKRDSIFCSIARRTMGRELPRQAMLTHRYRQTGRPNGYDKRRDGHSGGEEHAPDEECGAESGDRPEPAAPSEREQGRDAR